ncbi:MAG: hypothetical protein HY722_08810 [Planctomycetes bacterium]|nr:hypothetical protein [Planctomycetota bacterium]
MTENEQPQPSAEKKGNKALVITLVCVGVGCFLVVPCIAIMAALVIPSLAGARDNALKAGCAAHLRQIGMACQQYSADFNIYPDRLETLVERDYLSNSGDTTCPAARTKGRADASYAWTPERIDRSTASRTPLARCPVDSHADGGVNVLQVDGSVNYGRPGDPDYQRAIETIP